MQTLRFDNTFVRELPTDPQDGPRRRQVHGALHSRVEPTPVCAPPIRRLGVGGLGYVNYRDHRPKNLRDARGLNAPVLYALVDGIGFQVIGGPVCRDSINWWNIQILGRGDVTGWFAEGGPGDYWIRVAGDE